MRAYQWILVLTMAWTSLGAIELDTAPPGESVETWLRTTRDSRFNTDSTDLLQREDKFDYFPGQLRYMHRTDPKTGQHYYYDQLQSRWYRYPVHFRGYHYNSSNQSIFRTQMAPGFQLFIDETKQTHRGHQSFGR